MADYGPSFTAAKLFRKTSAKGTTYFVGRMGGVKIAVLKTKELTDNGDEIWSLVFSEAAPYAPKAEIEVTDDARARNGRRLPDVASTPMSVQAAGPDPEIPF